jgi:mRNA interferase RelE/StbE
MYPGLDFSTNIWDHMRVARYAVEIERTAAKAITRMQQHLAERVLTAIEALAGEPRPVGCVKLAGTTDGYRIRVGDYRVVYVIEDAVRIVTVTRVAHRREVYREKR